MIKGISSFVNIDKSLFLILHTEEDNNSLIIERANRFCMISGCQRGGRPSSEMLTYLGEVVMVPFIVEATGKEIIVDVCYPILYIPYFIYNYIVVIKSAYRVQVIENDQATFFL
jgi:hypothetical protein